MTEIFVRCELLGAVSEATDLGAAVSRGLLIQKNKGYMMMIKRLTQVLTLTAALLIGVSTAHAGEITGNGKSLKNADETLNGKSICAFSGQNDTYSGNPAIPDEDGFFRTQSWGQLPSAIRAFLRSISAGPGDACNGRKNPQ